MEGKWKIRRHFSWGEAFPEALSVKFYSVGKFFQKQ